MAATAHFLTLDDLAKQSGHYHWAKVSKREIDVVAALQSLVQRHTDQVPALDGILFNLVPGDIVGLLVPNGAGKTTTLKRFRVRTECDMTP